MKYPTLVPTLAALLAVATVPLAALPLGTNITIPDNNTYGSGWYGNHEDNETEAHPFTVQGQQWDLEGMFLNGTTLTLVGGYDFKNGETYGGKNYRSGDLFIDLDGDAVYGDPVNSGSGLGGTTSNLFGYDLVFDLDYATGTYDFVDLRTGSTLLERGLDVASSNPWRYRSGGSLISSGNAFTYTDGLSNLDVGFLGYNGNNDHYALAFDTSVLGSGDFTFHYTMECGNDNLMGRASVPDSGTTALLLGSALLALFGAGRRFRRS